MPSGKEDTPLPQRPAGWNTEAHAAGEGADRIAELEASRLGLTVEVYEAEWGRYGQRAGFLRNEAMLSLPGVAGVRVFRVPGKNNGTDHIVRICREAGVPGRLVRPRS